MRNKQKPGFTFTETLIIGAVFAIVLIMGTLLLSVERARTRDAIRIGDMTRLAGAFALLHAREASYASAAAGCATVGSPAASCALTAVVPNLGEMADPGKFSYAVSRVPDTEDFGVSFKLERNYGNLKAGTHILTKNGIQ